jgi:hypothetical protein
MARDESRQWHQSARRFSGCRVQEPGRRGWNTPIWNLRCITSSQTAARPYGTRSMRPGCETTGIRTKAGLRHRRAPLLYSFRRTSGKTDRSGEWLFCIGFSSSLSLSIACGAVMRCLVATCGIDLIESSRLGRISRHRFRGALGNPSSGSQYLAGRWAFLLVGLVDRRSWPATRS